MIKSTEQISTSSIELQIQGCQGKSADSQAQVSGGISDLVWKHFQDEIRQALAEAQQQLAERSGED